MKTTIAGLTTLLLLAPLALYADHDDDDEHERGRGARAGRAAVLPPSEGLTQYRAECGSCHLAYPPGMLPARSWSRILEGLGDHFGENAELSPAAVASLTDWLRKNAAESGTHPRSKKVLKSAQGTTPLRISELRFIQREHAELAAAVWQRPAVKTVANCGACHLDAEQWSFSEHRIEIPR